MRRTSVIRGLLHAYQECSLHSDSIAGRTITVNGMDTVNLATFNFHDLLSNQDVQVCYLPIIITVLAVLHSEWTRGSLMTVSLFVKMAAEKGLTKYGCGACGPRGFYGSFGGLYVRYCSQVLNAPESERIFLTTI